MFYALCDCNNFFVSCERVFRPDLEGKPVVVLSGNDGCVISRSNEAKALGIKMGEPWFQIDARDLTAFSSNFSFKVLKVKIVKAKRNINSNGNKRGEVDEVLIRNYE